MNKKKIVVVSSDSIGEKMAGPGIRYFQIASMLSKEHEVVLLVPNSVTPVRNLNIIKLTTKNLKTSMNQADIIIIQGMTMFKYSFIKKFNGSIIIDLYDPTMLEMLEIRTRKYEYYIDLEIVKEQLKYGDFFICASEKQKDLWIGMLLAIGRITPVDYNKDKSLSKFIGIVPFGIEQSTPVKKSNPYLKFSDIKEDDKILVWGGGIWDWLDPFTLIHALYRIVQSRQDIKIVFMGTKHPTQSSIQMKAANEAILLAEKYGLIGKSIFFNDWVPYAERDQYLKYAFAGVSFHINHLETKYSFRTRILDYIWCQLPMILTEGDLLADIIQENVCGITVKEKDIDAIEKAIIRLVEDEYLYQTFKNNLNNLKEKYFWESVLKDLTQYCSSPTKNFERKKELVGRSLKLKCRYFLSKLPFLLTKEGIKKALSILKTR